MRSSDWSSDVCSSDLIAEEAPMWRPPAQAVRRQPLGTQQHDAAPVEAEVAGCGKADQDEKQTGAAAGRQDERQQRADAEERDGALGGVDDQGERAGHRSEENTS